MKKALVLILTLALLLAVSVCFADNGTAAEGDKSLYDKAYRLYENKKYYEAWEMFNESQYGDWERMAKKCVRRWPETGQLYHDTSQWLRDTHLTFKVDQPADTAVFIRVFKESRLLSEVFIGGTDEVTIEVPGNQKYTIRDGVGSLWFGQDEAFGPIGAYETMTFSEYNRDNDTVYLEARYNYTININVDNAAGDPIGSEDAEWKSFLK